MNASGNLTAHDNPRHRPVTSRQAGESLLVFDRDEVAVKGAEALGAKGAKSTAEALQRVKGQGEGCSGGRKPTIS